MPKKYFCPVVLTNCADCGVGTITIREWYMVKTDVWEQAWAGRRKPWYDKIPGQEILCIGCLEKRIGRTLSRHDFSDAPLNWGDHYRSDRLTDRLTKSAIQARYETAMAEKRAAQRDNVVTLVHESQVRVEYHTADSLIESMVERVLQSVPGDQRARLRASWEAINQASDNDDGPEAA